MNSDEEDTEEAEVYAATEKMAQPTSDIPETGDNHTLYERRAQQYLQLSDGRKALANAVKAVEYRNDSFIAHWLAGKSYVSMAMYDPGIFALSTAIELCCLEDKRQEILIDLLVHYGSRENNLSGATGVLRNISDHTLATVAYELTKTRRFNAAYIAYSQLQKAGRHPSDINFDLQPLCDLDAVTNETWILDLITYFLRYGSDHNTMTSQTGDTYIHVVVRMTLAAGVLGLLEYVLRNVVRPGELKGLLDCLGNTALHMAAQCQKCSPLVRLGVMTLLVEAGVDGTAKNIKGKTAGSYLSRDEKDVLQFHQAYDLICFGMAAKKMKQAVNKTYNNVDVTKSEDDYEAHQESAQDEHIQIQERETTERALIASVSSKTHSNDCSQSLDTISDGNSFQEKTTNNQEQPVPATEEKGKPMQEPPISISQDNDEKSSRNTDGQIISESVPVESVISKQQLVEFNPETITINLQNGLPEQQVYQTSCVFDDVQDDHSSLRPLEYNYNISPPKAGTSKNSDVTKNRAECGELTCASTDEDIDGIEYTAFHYVQASSFEVIAPDDNENVSAKITFVQKNDDRYDDAMPVSLVFNDNDNSLTEKKVENESNESELGQDVTLNETTSKSLGKVVTQQRDIVLDENASVKFQCDSTGVIPSEDIIANDTSCRQTSDEHSQHDDGIDHHTVEADEQQVSATSDTPFVDSDEQFDDTSTTDKGGCETEHHSHTHSEKGLYDHDTEKLLRSDTIPRCRNNSNETEVIEATESKTTRDKLKSLFKEGKSLLKLKHYNKAFAVFVKLLNLVPARSTNEHITMTIKLICTSLGGSDDEVTTENLIHISLSHVRQILKGLLGRRKWFPFLSLIRQHHDIHASKEQLKDIVSEICLETIVGDPQFLNKTQYLENVMTGLLDIGAPITNEGQSCIHACIKSGHYEIIPLLLSRGAHPRHLTMYTDDTPVHAALTIALTKGHCEAFELLLTKFQEDPQVYCMCDPTAKDGNGDGLLHLVLRQPDGCQSRTAIDLLITHIRNPLALLSKNKKGEHPIDLIREQSDPRWKTLNPFFGCIPAAQFKRLKEKKLSRSAAYNQTGKSSSDVNNAMNETVVSDTDIQVTTQEFPSNKSEKNDLKSEISVDDKKILVSAFPARKDNLNEEIRKRTKKKVVPQEDEEKKANVLQVRKREGNVQQNEEAKEERVPEKERDQMRQERGFDRTAEKIILTKSEVRNAEFAFIQQVQDDEKIQLKKRVEHSREDETMDEGEEENVDEGCNDNDDEMATCATTKQMNDGNEDDNLLMNQDEPADQTSNAFLDQISSELDDLPWEVECTKSFIKTMTSKINSTIKNKIIRTISTLAKGNWRQSICKELHYAYKPKNTQLYESKIGKGSRLIWQRAIAFSSKLSATTVDTERHTYRNKKTTGTVMYSEVIRIWNYVNNHDDIHQYVVNICSALKNEKQEDFKRDPQPPSTFQRTLPVYFGSDSTEIGVLRPPVKVANEEFQIVKFYTFSPDMLKHICRQSSLNVDFPFRITDLEHSIINLGSDAPILLIGRSGTGKTTCCLYRLWHQFIAHLSIHCELQEQAKQEIGSENCHGGHYQAAESNKDVKNPGEALSTEPEDEKQHTLDDSVLLHNRLHQIFVTRNRLLCSEAKRNFNDMKNGSYIAQKFGICDDSPLPWHFDDIRDSQYPLFLTLEQLLILMDASVGPKFFYERESNGSLKGIKRTLFEEDSSISGITEQIRKGSIVVHNESSEFKEASKQPTEVTYEVFCDIVWPKIATGCKYQPLLVWMEIISIIKGSYEALLQPKGYLSREMYLVVGRKRAPNFDGNRDEIYDLFQKYQKFSDKKNLFDECDLINSVKSRLQPHHVKAWSIHQLFVDEIQDFTQAELCLLIKICQDPNQMFLTGDTAQTVMHGIEFRFCDLRSLFFNIRETMKTDSVPGKYLVEVPDKVHQLTHSYRSHNGILSLASSVLDIIAHLFPGSFDHLQADKSLIEGGPLPVLLESSNFSDLVRHISDNKEETEDAADIELGVHQAILVINETARQQLPRQLQQNITLTIYESKGLEFNNIFLFNFFKFSQASKEWRAVTSLLTELTQNDTDTTSSRTGMYELDEGKLHGKNRPRALKFDPKLHKVLNSELKLLYTAVTRARVNVLIFDEDEENRRPMFDYFQARNLVSVQTKRFTKDDFNEPASENDEWLARGEEFMRTRVYREAAKCFKKGGDIKSADIANAFHNEVIARNMRDQASRKTKLLQTAELYCKCGFHSKAIECYEEVGDFRAAAEYCDDIGKAVRINELAKRRPLLISTYEQAAKIYIKRLNNPVKSSHCYQKAKLYDSAVLVLYESGHYENALDVVSRYDKQLKEMESENKIIPQLMKNHHPCKQYNREDLRIKCAEFYHRENKEDKMMEHLGYLSFNEQCKNLLQWNRIDLTVKLMQEKGKYEEASRLCLSKGKSEEALAIARKSSNKEVIAEYLLRDIQSHICNNQVLDKSRISNGLQELFDLLRLIKTNWELQGQAYLLKAELIGGIAKEGEKALGEALSAFKQCDPPCMAGQIDCLNLMLKNLTQSNISSAVEEMHTLLGVVELFEKTASTKDNDSKTIKVICNYFGYEYSVDRLLLKKYRPHHLDPEIKRRCKSENESDVTITTLSIILKELAHEWYTKIQSSMQEWIENLQTCNKSCNSHLRCGCLKKLLDIDLLHIELDGYLAGTLRCINITAQKSVETSLEPCNTFLRHLLPQQFIKRSSKEEWYALADRFRKTKSTVKERLITALKFEYGYITQRKRKQSTNLFMKLHFLVKYLKLDMKPQEMMKTFEKDLTDELSRKKNKPKALGKIRHLGCLVSSEPIEILAARFVEAYDNISDYMDPVGALVKFTVFLKLLRGYDREVLPDHNYLVMWMEYFLVVASYLAAKADSQMSFLLPTSYIHVTHYIDSSFDSEREATMNVIARTGKKELKLHVIQERMGVIALFLCGNGYKNGLINAVFSTGNIDFEVSERVVMLSLTCMCNIERMSNTSSEQLLLKQLRSVDLPKNAPPRLKEAIQTLKTAKGLLDVGNLFRKLLFERGEELHTHSFHRGNVQSKSLTILNGILPDTFHEDTAHNQLQPQETDTTKESANTEHGEAPLVVHQAKTTYTSEEPRDTEQQEATPTQLQPKETDKLAERCGTRHADATLALLEPLKSDSSGKCIDTGNEMSTHTTLKIPWKDASEARGYTEHEKATLSQLQTQETGTSGEHGVTKHVEDRKLIQKEVKRRNDDGQPETNKVVDIDWFSFPQ